MQAARYTYIRIRGGSTRDANFVHLVISMYFEEEDNRRAYPAQIKKNATLPTCLPTWFALI